MELQIAGGLIGSDTFAAGNLLVDDFVEGTLACTLACLRILTCPPQGSVTVDVPYGSPLVGQMPTLFFEVRIACLLACLPGWLGCMFACLLAC